MLLTVQELMTSLYTTSNYEHCLKLQRNLAVGQSSRRGQGQPGYRLPEMPPGSNRLLSALAGLPRGVEAAPPAPFVPDESTIARLQDMGFSRAHVMQALTETESNRPEVAMEFLLTHPPPYESAQAETAPATEASAAAEGGADADAGGDQPAEPAPNASAAAGPLPPPPDQPASSSDAASAAAQPLPPAQPDDDTEEAAAAEAAAEALKAETARKLKEKEAQEKLEKEEARKQILQRECAEARQLFKRLHGSALGVCFWLVEGKAVEAQKEAQALAKAKTITGTSTTKGKDSASKGGSSGMVDSMVANFLMELTKLQKGSGPTDDAGMKSLVGSVSARTGDLLAQSSANAEAEPQPELAGILHLLLLLVHSQDATRNCLAQKGLDAKLIGLVNSTVTAMQKQGSEGRWPESFTVALLVLNLLALGMEEAPSGTASAASGTPGAGSASSSTLAVPLADSESKEDGSKELSLTLVGVEESLPTARRLLSRQDQTKLLDVLVTVVKGASNNKLPTPEPTLMHALLKLLSRVVMTYRCAQQMLSQGGAAALMALPAESSFEGRTTLVAATLRHLLEDPVTLQNSMETELRTSYQRVLNSSRGPERATAGVKLQHLLQAVFPMVYRD
ncbi:unnamed protein product, partial [Chrysoparadoxa australica]